MNFQTLKELVVKVNQLQWYYPCSNLLNKLLNVAEKLYIITYPIMKKYRNNNRYSIEIHSLVNHKKFDMAQYEIKFSQGDLINLEKRRIDLIDEAKEPKDSQQISFKSVAIHNQIQDQKFCFCRAQFLGWKKEMKTYSNCFEKFHYNCFEFELFERECPICSYIKHLKNEKPLEYFEKQMREKISQKLFKIMFECFLFLYRYISDNMINVIWEIQYRMRELSRAIDMI